MTWTYSNAKWTKAGSGREFLAFASTIPNPGQVSIGCEDIAHALSIVLRADADGRTGYEVAIVGVDLVLRFRRFNKTQTAVASAPHGVSGGRPFTLRARLDGTIIVGIVVREDGTTVEIQADIDDRSAIATWGIASAESGATATASTAGVSANITTVNEVIYWVQGGDLYAIYSGTTVELLATGLYGQDDTVQTESLDGVAYFVGAGRARKANMVTRVAGAWTPTAGTLPGQTSAGTTTATLITSMLGSLVLAGIPAQPLAIYGSASGEPLNWDLTDLAAGKAWIRGVGDSATIGDPITCITQGPNGSLFVGCTNSINFLVGNPYEGTDQIITRSRTYGVSGPNAALLVGTPGGGDVMAFHSPPGLMIAPLGGAPIPVSIDTLTQFITFDPADRASVRVTMARDPERRMLLIALSGQTRQVSYFENIGGYQAGGRGFFPITLPVAPSCAIVWKGKAVYGTSDGRLVRFGAAGAMDLGAPITTLLSSHLIHSGPIESDAILSRMILLMPKASASCDIRIYTGSTPEECYGPDRHLATGPRTFGPNDWAWSMHARGPAMVATFTCAAGVFTLEAIDCDFDMAEPTRRSVLREAAVPPAPCRPAVIPPAPPTPPTPTETGDGDGGELPDGNPDPDETPVAEALKLPFPPKYDGGFSVPFDAPFWGQWDYDGFGPSRVINAPPMEYVLDYGDPEPGGGIVRGVQNRHANTFDRGPSRFGPGVKIDTLKPTYVIVSGNQGGLGPIITEAPGFEPWGGGASQ